MDEIEKAEQLIGLLADEPREAWRDVALARLARAPRGFVNSLAAAYLIDQAGSRVRLQVVATERGAERGAKPRREPTPVASDTERLRREDEDATRREHWRQMVQIVEDYTAKMRITWTAELLDSPVALRDGTTVLWGDATVEQHRARYAMHAANAVAGAEGAARHLQAINDIEAAGVENLRELVAVAA